jgi:hypothetical protein
MRKSASRPARRHQAFGWPLCLAGIAEKAPTRRRMILSKLLMVSFYSYQGNVLILRAQLGPLDQNVMTRILRALFPLRHPRLHRPGLALAWIGLVLLGLPPARDLRP